MVELFSPSLAGDPQAAEFTARFERSSASPAMVQQIFEMFLDIDVRAVCPPSTADARDPPARRPGGQSSRRRGARRADPGARYVELPGIDHFPGRARWRTWSGRQGVPDRRAHGGRAHRVLATVMFTDICGSTERAAELGDAAWRELLAAHQAAVRRQLERFRGHQVKTLGDGFLATFDGPARAIQCGVAIAESARSIGLEVRIGLHAGEVEVMDEDVGGIAVHIAARVEPWPGLGSPGHQHGQGSGGRIGDCVR